jgi:adhesin transport system outer membrane protein
VRRLNLLAVLSITLVLQNAAGAVTLEQELATLLTEHPTIRGSEKNLQAAAESIEIARAGYLPQLNLTGDFGPQLIDNPTTRGRGEGNDFARPQTTSTLIMTQNLFDGFATSTALRTAQLNRSVAALSLEGTRQNILLEGIAAYLNVLRQLRLVELARSREETIQTQLELEDERVLSGSGITVDVLQAKSRLQIAKERRVTFEGALKQSVARYTQVFNHVPDLAALIDPDPPVESLPEDLETSIDIALSENAAIANGDASVELARERRQLIRAELFPRINAVGNAGYQKHAGGTLGTQRDYSVVLQAQWNLFSGFTTKNSMQQAAFQYGATKDQLEQVMRQVVEQVRVSWHGLITLRDRMELLENAINIASEVFTSRKQLRDAGKETVINVLDAEGEIFNARINFTAAAYDERLAVYQMLLSLGRLTPAQLQIPAG